MQDRQLDRAQGLPHGEGLAGRVCGWELGCTGRLPRASQRRRRAAAAVVPLPPTPSCYSLLWLLPLLPQAEDAVHMFFQHNIECPVSPQLEVGEGLCRRHQRSSGLLTALRRRPPAALHYALPHSSLHNTHWCPSRALLPLLSPAGRQQLQGQGESWFGRIVGPNRRRQLACARIPSCPCAQPVSSQAARSRRRSSAAVRDQGHHHLR